MRKLIVILLILFACKLLAQDVMIADSHTYLPVWYPFIDTLEANGVNIHYTSIEGWDNLNEMDLLWLCLFHVPDYDTLTCEQITDIVEYVRSGGQLVIFFLYEQVHFINYLLLDSRWNTTMKVEDVGLYAGFELNCVRTFSPFTDNVDSIKLSLPTYIDCGENAFQIAAVDSACATTVIAMSFPFLNEGNCSSFVFVITGAYYFAWAQCSQFIADNWRFGSNVLLTAAGVPGYEFDPCAFADSMLVPKIDTDSLCHRTPNPFTPNGDGINDEAEFEFPGLGEVPGTIKIFTLGNLRVRTIEVPSGAGAKQEAIWDGKDDTGAPMREGIYLYTIRAEGRIKCQGTVTLAR